MHQQDFSGVNSSGYVPPYHQAGRGYDDDDEGGKEGEGLFSSAVKMAKAAGEKLAAAESEVWRRINGEKS
jgi:hypothetical protein